LRISLKHLGAEQFLIREEGSGTRASMEHVFATRGLSPVAAAFRAFIVERGAQIIQQAVGRLVKTKRGTRLKSAS
jgi:hypothetical protein